MNESQLRQALQEWNKILCQEKIPYAIIGSAAMLLHKCPRGRNSFKDIDLLVPVDRAQEEVKRILKEKGFMVGKNKNYVKGDLTIGVATPKTHIGLPCPTDKSLSTMIDGICVMKLDGLIEAKRLAVISQMDRIKKAGYRRYREKSVAKHLRDFCALCFARDKKTKVSNNRLQPMASAVANP